MDITAHERYAYWKGEHNDIIDNLQAVTNANNALHVRQFYFEDADPESIRVTDARLRVLNEMLDHAQRQVAYWYNVRYAHDEEVMAQAAAI